MIWYSDLFVGESVAHKQKSIIRKVKRRSACNFAYLLALSTNTDNIMDILSCQVVRRKHYPTKDRFMIGLAGDYEEACELAGQIISSVYQATGDFKLRDMIKQTHNGDREDGSI